MIPLKIVKFQTIMSHIWVYMCIQRIKDLMRMVSTKFIIIYNNYHFWRMEAGPATSYYTHAT
jgi:hypothetical protein